MPACDCDVAISVKKCESHEERADQINNVRPAVMVIVALAIPVQEIVHGFNAPNAVIATAIHELLPVDQRKMLAFADSRQEAAFFAWYAEDSYQKLRDRNLILRAMKDSP